MFSELLLLKEEQSLNILVFSVKQRVFRFFWTLIKKLLKSMGIELSNVLKRG